MSGSGSAGVVDVPVSVEVAGLVAAAGVCVGAGLPGFGLGAGDRPSVEVQVLGSVFASVEFELARRMHAAFVSGSLPLSSPGGLLTARGWGSGLARRLARAGAFVSEYPALGEVWAAGLINSEHVDAVARNTGQLTVGEVQVVVGEVVTRAGLLSPAAVVRLMRHAQQLLHPPGGDGCGGESDAYQSRSLTFSILGDTVLLSATLPRLEGETVLAAIDAIAEKLRSTTDHVPAGARRADALLEMVNSHATTTGLPTRNGLTVGLTVTLEHTTHADPVWATSRGHTLTPDEQTFVACNADITPIRTTRTTRTFRSTGHTPHLQPEPQPTTAGRITALAELLFDGPRIPLEVGRTHRTATTAQRKALTIRDKGCIIPGCDIPPENCQTHHITEWANNGPTDITNLTLVCWAHHRQIEQGTWTITPNPDPDPHPEHQKPDPHQRTTWPGNNGSPWTIHIQPRNKWRL